MHVTYLSYKTISQLDKIYLCQICYFRLFAAKECQVETFSTVF